MSLPIESKQLQNEIESGLAPMNRRRFLSASTRLTLAVGMGGLVSACSDAPKDKIAAGGALSSSQMAFFQRMSEVLLPTEGTAMTPLASVPVLGNLDSLFGGMPEKVRGDLGMAIDLFEHAGLVMGWHFSRFTRMSDQDAVSYIDSWQSGHPMQQGIITVLKKLIYASYWRDEKTWPPLQFDGPVSEKWGLPSLGEAPLPARAKV